MSLHSLYLYCVPAILFIIYFFYFVSFFTFFCFSLFFFVLFFVYRLFFFFFSSRRRHTRCLSDWSSDVCSSDLDLEPGAAGGTHRLALCRDASRDFAAPASPQGGGAGERAPGWHAASLSRQARDRRGSAAVSGGVLG